APNTPSIWSKPSVFIITKIVWARCTSRPRAPTASRGPLFIVFLRSSTRRHYLPLRQPLTVTLHTDVASTEHDLVAAAVMVGIRIVRGRKIELALPVRVGAAAAVANVKMRRMGRTQGRVVLIEAQRRACLGFITIGEPSEHFGLRQIAQPIQPTVTDL